MLAGGKSRENIDYPYLIGGYRWRVASNKWESKRTHLYSSGLYHHGACVLLALTLGIADSASEVTIRNLRCKSNARRLQVNRLIRKRRGQHFGSMLRYLSVYKRYLENLIALASELNSVRLVQTRI